MLSRHDSLLPVLKAVTNLESFTNGAQPQHLGANNMEVDQPAEARNGYQLRPASIPGEVLLEPLQPQTLGLFADSKESLNCCQSGSCIGQTGSTKVEDPIKCTKLEQRPKLQPRQLRSQMAQAVGESAILEPEIMFVVGDALSLAGCPPWHARFSEIYHLGAAAKITQRGFQRALDRFMGTEQRFGT
eukprot:evm.model.scf_328.10 EVM.evm.TU.scf_328.10   scf_328:80303-80863(+)